MPYVCCSLCLCSISWDGRKVMNMHKAKRYTQVTCLTCVTVVNNCTRKLFSLLSPSLRNKGVMEGRRVISWEHFSFSLCGWKTNPLMMQTHMQKCTKPSSSYTNRHERNNHTHTHSCKHTYNTIRLRKLYANVFFCSKCVLQGNVLPSFPTHWEFVVN